MGHISLSADRRARVVSVALAAAASLYFILALVAEPLGSYPAYALTTATGTTVLSVTVTGAASISCTASASLGSISGNTASPTGTGAMGTSQCTVITNNTTGYNLNWVIKTGSGDSRGTSNGITGGRYGTGHMLNMSLTGGFPDAIQAFARKGGHVSVPFRFDYSTGANGANITSGSGSRWAGRLRGNSTTVGGGTVSWGSDSATEGFLNVGTGYAVQVAKRTSETSSTGDVENFLWKVLIPASTFQPTGTYKVEVQVSMVDNW